MKKICPFINSECIEHSCMMWKDLIFNGPDGSETRWDCSIRWLVPLTVEVAKETRQAAASADKKATEFQMGLSGLALIANRKQLEVKDESGG